MSFILDALRKSEIERQRDAAPGLMRSPQATVRHEIPVWSWLLIGLLSLTLAGLAAAWWFRDSSGGDIAAVVEQPATAPRALPVAAPQAARPDSGAPVDTPANAGEPLPISDLIRAEPDLPRYSLSFLEYNGADPGRGSAWINGRRYYPGQTVDGGLELVGIRADGVVLAYRGQTYLLTPR